MLVDKIVNRPPFILLGKLKDVDAKLLEMINDVRFHQAVVNVDTIKYFLGDAAMPDEYRTNPDEWLNRHYHDHARHTGGADANHVFVWMIGSVNQHLRHKQQEEMRRLVPDHVQDQMTRGRQVSTGHQTLGAAPKGAQQLSARWKRSELSGRQK